MSPHKTIPLLLALAFGCGNTTESGSNREPQPVPCDPGATELHSRLRLANGVGVDLGEAGVEDQVEAAKASLLGRSFAFTGCRFASQGNDTVNFAASSGADPIECVMVGGEQGNAEFRRAAVQLAFDKLRLDVRGTVVTRQGHFGRTSLTLGECTITPHE
jgi:hypothetical protein